MPQIGLAFDETGVKALPTVEMHHEELRPPY